MNKLKSVIIDDELNAIKTLEWELSNLDKMVEIEAKFTKANEAVEYLTYNAHNIDLIFLDIQMPKLNGFEFLDKFKSRTFEVIFITAYDEYAIKAIKESAIDYILKPVDIDELEQAVKKVIALRNETNPDNEKITIPFENKLIFVDPEDIVYCKSDGNYCKINTKSQSYFVSKTLKYIEELLPKAIFYRIHQSYIINLKNITSFDKSTNYVMLDNDKELPVSRSKRREFLEQL